MESKRPGEAVVNYCLAVSRRPRPFGAVLRTGYSVPPGTRRCERVATTRGAKYRIVGTIGIAYARRSPILTNGALLAGARAANLKPSCGKA